MIPKHLDIVYQRIKWWKIQINEPITSNITFTLKTQLTHQNVISIIISLEIKYHLGFILDEQITGNPHLKSKRKALNDGLHLLLFSWFKNEH